MTEQQRGRRAIEIGPTGKTVAANLSRLRERRGITTRQLSGMLERAGRSIPASGITRMEKGERVVTSDDLAALAVVLGVSPAALLLPLTDSDQESVEVTGMGPTPASDAWAWASTRRPLKMAPGNEQTELLEYQLYGLPPWLRDLWGQMAKAGDVTGLPPRRLRELLDGLAEDVDRLRDQAGGEDG
ncbi:helix-turn-helix transcriptional regulator [Streptomyces sp. NA02950]|uniref:helix-turn-helix domain-containing protein n=1 Tax=Streptomyces sp. NA02950 TaxID=2742137 RepID=UPI0015908B9F|nr:helix-turn-helix transcriptional regulator [Streptomyces sp. NA02950]QKV94222.1 helix-turn-helix transcriptional regulator [Streptomyces sp. NA02950]